MQVTAVKADKGSTRVITEGAGITKGSLQGVGLEAEAGPECGRSCGPQGRGHCVEKGGVAIRSRCLGKGKEMQFGMCSLDLRTRRSVALVSMT